MRRDSMRLILLLLALCAVTLCHAQEQPLFFPTIPSRNVVATIESKPRRVRLLMFTATWCGPCQITKKQMATYLGTSPVPWVIDETPQAHVQLVDSDRNPQLVARYQIVALPTFVLIDDDKPILTGGSADMKTMIKAVSNHGKK